MRLLIWIASLLGLKRLLADPDRSRALKVAVTLVVAVFVFLLVTLFFSLFGRLWSQSQGLALTYAALVILVVTLAAWRLRERPAGRTIPRNPYAQRRHAERAAAAIAARLQDGGAAEHPLVLLGLPGVGRHALQAGLQAHWTGSPIVIADDLGADPAGNAIIARRCPPDATAVLVVTQDLFSYQMPVIEELATRDGTSLIVFLNKCDLLGDEARDTVLGAIAAKCTAWPVAVRAGAAAPRAREVIAVDAQGRESVRRLGSEPRLNELLDILGRADKLKA